MKTKLSYDIFSHYRSTLMGIATLSVLFFHYTDDCRIYEYNFDGFNQIFNRYISSTGVDIFLLLSGLGLYYAWKKNQDYKMFIKKRITRIVIPYLLIAIPAYIVRDIVIRDLEWISVLKGISFYDFLTAGKTWHWYIFMILVCYLIFPWLYEIVEENKTKIQSQTTMIGVFTFVTVLAILLQEYYKPVFGNLNIMLLRFPVFVLGVFVGRASYENRSIGKEWIVLGIIALFCLPLREANRVMIVRYVLGLFNVFLLFSITISFRYMKIYNIKLDLLKKIVEWFGKYSLELYLTHVTIRSIMNDMGYYTCRIRFYLIMMIISVLLSLLIKEITNLFHQKKN